MDNPNTVVVDGCTTQFLTSMHWRTLSGIHSKGDLQKTLKPYFEEYSKYGVAEHIGKTIVNIGLSHEDLELNKATPLLPMVTALKQYIAKGSLKDNSDIQVQIGVLHNEYIYCMVLDHSAVLLDSLQDIPQSSDEDSTHRDRELQSFVREVTVRIEDVIALESKPVTITYYGSGTKQFIASNTKIEKAIEDMIALNGGNSDVNSITDNMHLEDILRSIEPRSATYITNLHKKRNPLPIKTIVGLALLGALGGGWYLNDQEEQKRAAAELKRLNDAHLAMVKSKNQSNASIQLATNPTEQVNIKDLIDEKIRHESAWLSQRINSTSDDQFKKSIDTIQGTVLSINGWKLSRVTIDSVFLEKQRELTTSKTYTRTDKKTTIKHILAAFPSAGIEPTGEIAKVANTTTMKPRSVEVNIAAATSLHNAIALMQKLENSNIITSWSLNQISLPTRPVLHTTKFIDDYNNINANRQIQQATWLIAVQRFKLTIQTTTTLNMEKALSSLNSSHSNVLHTLDLNLSAENFTAETDIYVQTQ